MYRVVEEIINNPFITTTSDRVGVPQHFGIYYAIGELQEAKHCFIDLKKWNYKL